jgi:hypothetical protein
MLTWRSGPWCVGHALALLVLLAVFVLWLEHRLTGGTAALDAALALAVLLS